MVKVNRAFKGPPQTPPLTPQELEEIRAMVRFRLDNRVGGVPASDATKLLSQIDTLQAELDRARRFEETVDDALVASWSSGAALRRIEVALDAFRASREPAGQGGGT